MALTQNVYLGYGDLYKYCSHESLVKLGYGDLSKYYLLLENIDRVNYGIDSQTLPRA